MQFQILVHSAQSDDSVVNCGIREAPLGKYFLPEQRLEESRDREDCLGLEIRVASSLIGGYCPAQPICDLTRYELEGSALLCGADSA